MLVQENLYQFNPILFSPPSQINTLAKLNFSHISYRLHGGLASMCLEGPRVCTNSFNIKKSWERRKSPQRLLWWLSYVGDHFSSTWPCWLYWDQVVDLKVLIWMPRGYCIEQIKGMCYYCIFYGWNLTNHLFKGKEEKSLKRFKIAFEKIQKMCNWI